MADTDNTQDIIDVRGIIERIESLEDDQPLAHDDDLRELDTLKALMAELAGCGGDEQWAGDWYPLTLIRDDYFEDYALELAADIGAIDADAKWPYTCIDWEKAANELLIDYSSVEYDGVPYWYR